jgi:hypothetical protein
VKGDVLYYYVLSVCCVIVSAKLMRFPRVKVNGHGFYHCVSRVVEGRFIFQTSGHGSAEAERFVQLMRCLEAFSGIRVLTYVLMSNHPVNLHKSFKINIIRRYGRFQSRFSHAI